MKKIVLAALCSTALISVASAADLAPAYAKASPATALISPAYNWTGFYAGLSAGYGWGRTEDTLNPLRANPDPTGGPLGAAPVKPSGGIYGGQFGYNYQLDSGIVLGVEADMFYADVSQSHGGTTPTDAYYGSDGLQAYGSVRGRVGYAFDRFLPFITGGLAFGKEKHGFGCDAGQLNQPSAVSCEQKTVSNYGLNGQKFYDAADYWSLGWTLGGGLEYAISDRWSIKGEYDYTDLGSNGVSMFDPNFKPAGVNSPRDFKTSYQTVKFGVNYRIN